MRKSFRQMTAAVLSLCLCLGAAPLPAGAIGLITEDNPQGLRYCVYEDHVTIMDCDDSVVDLVIPETLDGLPVTYFETDWMETTSFLGCKDLESVTLPSGFTGSIGWIFDECPKLSAVYVDDANPDLYDIDGVVYARGGEHGDALVYYPQGREGAYAIPDGVTAIRMGSNAIGDCTGMTSLYIPASMEQFYVSLSGCTSLTEITVAEDNPNYCSVDGVLFNKDKTELIEYPAAKEGAYTIPEGVTKASFGNCPGLTALTVPEGVTELTLGNCPGLTELTVPEGVTKLSLGNCPGLTSLTLPESLTSLTIGDQSTTGEGEGGCPGLTELVLPAGLTSLGTLIGCTGLTSLTLPESLTSMGSVQNCGLTELVIPAGVTSMYTIADCQQLASITFPEGMTRMPDIISCPALTSLHLPDAVTRVDISGCPALTSIHVPDAVTSIGISECAALTSVNIPDAVTWVSFSGCPSLTDIEISDTHPQYTYTDGMFLKDNYGGDGYYVSNFMKGRTGEVIIPEGVTSISDRVFQDCTGITSVQFPASLSSISYGAFSGCTGLTTVALPASLKYIEGAFAGCTSLTAFTLPEGSESFSVRDGVLYSKDGTKLVCCPAGKEGVFTVPDGVTAIGNYAFKGCEKLTQIVLPEGVKETGYNAFEGCTAMESIDLPEGLTTIGSSAFNGCTALRELTFPRSITKIERQAVFDCPSLEKITILNPYCELSNYNSLFATDYDHYWWYFKGTICGYEGSSAQIHARHNAYRFESIGKVPGLGDVNDDGNVNANDASAVLMAAARIGAKRDSGLTEIQTMCANVDRGSDAVNANDASFVLRFAAYRGAKGTKDIYRYFGYEA